MRRGGSEEEVNRMGFGCDADVVTVGVKIVW